MLKSTIWRGFTLGDASFEVGRLPFFVISADSICRTCCYNHDLVLCDPVLEQGHEACLIPTSRRILVGISGTSMYPNILTYFQGSHRSMAEEHDPGRCLRKERYLCNLPYLTITLHYLMAMIHTNTRSYQSEQFRQVSAGRS